MADDVKSFPPTELKLARLRSLGIYARCRDMQIFAVLLGLAIAVFFLIELFGDRFLQFAIDSFAQSGDFFLSSDRTGLEGAFNELLISLFSVVFIVAVAALLSGLLQSRFLFALSLLRLNFSFLEVNPISSFTMLPSRAGGALLRLGKFSLWMIIACLAFRSLMQVVIEPSCSSCFPLIGDNGGIDFGREQFNRSNQEIVSLVFSSLLPVLYYVLAGSFIFAVLSRLVAVISFRVNQRMTRAELIAEYREQEPQAQYREARRGFFD